VNQEEEMAELPGGTGESTSGPSFNPDRVAALETAGWKAYAARNWARFLLAITRVNAEEFGMPFPQSALASWYIVRASAAWVPADHNEDVVRSYLERYYRMVRRFSGLHFDPKRAAYCELRYWDAHRRAVRQDDKSDFLAAMIALHSVVFGIAPDKARESAELRVGANTVYDPIALGEKRGTKEEWDEVQSLLQRCYRSAQRAMSETR
jgi:hypothetical protein